MGRNNMCDGSHCNKETGEVKLYPLGGGGNLILCGVCWAHENKYNYNRGRETGRPEDFPQHDWYKAKVYNPEG